MSNNKFLDTSWINAQISINFEHFPFLCPDPPFTATLIVNNLVKNSRQPNPALSYIYFTMNYFEEGFQQVVISNNTFENVQYFAPGLFKIIKAKMIKLTVTFENN